MHTSTNLRGPFFMDIERFVGADEAAEFLCITRRRLLEMARAARIPAHAIGGGKRKTWRFRLSELAEAVVEKEPDITAGKRGMITAGGSLAVVPNKRRKS